MFIHATNLKIIRRIEEIIVFKTFVGGFESYSHQFESNSVLLPSRASVNGISVYHEWWLRLSKPPLLIFS
jgi:hypothetical protein